MGRAISVKVRKEKVISALSAKLASNVLAVADNERIREQYKKDQDAWQKTILKDYADVLTLENVNARWGGRLEITYQIKTGVELPSEPKQQDTQNELGRYEVQEIENAIRILEMSEDEFVSASTMKQIASYL